jgi:hypothetical protein
MRHKSTPTALAAALAVLVATTAALAQGEPAPPPPPSEPAQPLPPAPGASVSFGSEGATAAPAPTGPVKDQPQGTTTAPVEEQKEPARLPWHGSILLFDQSTTAQTIGIGKDYLSSNPVYEMWFSLRPRYYFWEDDYNTLNVNLRMDIYHELTNSEETTRRTEAVFGDIWLNSVYARTLVKKGDWVTKVSTGPRILFPTAKSSYMSGNRLKIGWGGGAEQAFPLAGKGKTWFPAARVYGSAYYTKYVNDSTTAVNPEFGNDTQDTGGRPLVTSQPDGAAMVNGQLLAAIAGDIHITEKLSYSAMYIWILRWMYGFPEETQVQTLTGPAKVARVEDPQTFRVMPWFLTNMDYDIIPELTLGIGYYNLANQIGPDGTRRNPLWSPDARVFFDITLNLDEIYTTAAGARPKEEATKKTGFAGARQQARAAALGASSGW